MERGGTETRHGLVFRFDPRARLVSRRHGLARWRHPEQHKYHLISQTCESQRGLLDGGKEEGEGIGVCGPRLEQTSEKVKRATVVKEKEER
jgi:hypothetical protein